LGAAQLRLSSARSTKECERDGRGKRRTGVSGGMREWTCKRKHFWGFAKRRGKGSGKRGGKGRNARVARPMTGRANHRAWRQEHANFRLIKTLLICLSDCSVRIVVLLRGVRLARVHSIGSLQSYWLVRKWQSPHTVLSFRSVSRCASLDLSHWRRSRRTSCSGAGTRPCISI